MSNLELRQRGLLDLVKNRGRRPCDPYLQRVADSRELAMVRKVALWWRAISIEDNCRFTARLLKRLGCFDARVADYFDHNATSPFIEELSRDFLASLQDHADPLVRAVSQFELALLQARASSVDTYAIEWDRNPDLVVLALESGVELPEREPEFSYRMQVGGHLPGMVTCVRELAAVGERG